VVDRVSEFDGQVAFVTGGARGIGRACCLRLAAGGARIALNYLGNDAAAQETRRAVLDAGGVCELFKADVGDAEALDGAVRAARATLGPISLLVANAGMTRLFDHSELTLDRWRESMRINLDGAFLSIQAVKDDMLARGGGSIVCISSIGALRPRARQIDYCAAKAGVIAMARCFAEALAPAVRVNVVAPGPTDTDMLAELDQSTFPARIEATPLKRFATAQEVAETVAFLLSDRSSFTTGQTVVLSGGAVMLP